MSKTLIFFIDFFHRGGLVLFFIFVLCCVLWYFLIAKYIDIKFTFHKKEAKLFEEFKCKSYDHKFSHFVRSYFISKIKLDTKRHLFFIETIIIVAPLVGLLGTVTGMIEVFDTLSQNGSSDIKLMASGISRATIPTMAGMSVALCGILFKRRLDTIIKNKIHSLVLKYARMGL